MFVIIKTSSKIEDHKVNTTTTARSNVKKQFDVAIVVLNARECSLCLSIQRIALKERKRKIIRKEINLETKRENVLPHVGKKRAQGSHLLPFDCPSQPSHSKGSNNKFKPTDIVSRSLFQHYSSITFSLSLFHFDTQSLHFELTLVLTKSLHLALFYFFIYFVCRLNCIHVLHFLFLFIPFVFKILKLRNCVKWQTRNTQLKKQSVFELSDLWLKHNVKDPFPYLIFLTLPSQSLQLCVGMFHHKFSISPLNQILLRFDY